ncbi:MAG: hypothetical protein ABIF89_00975, partial [bacterium]
MKFNFDKKAVISLGIFFLTFFSLILFLIVPLFAGIRKSSAEFLARIDRLTNLRREIEEIEEAEIFYRDRAPDMQRIEKLFVNTELPIDFMMFLEDSATQAGLIFEASSVNSSGISAD